MKCEWLFVDHSVQNFRLANKICEWERDWNQLSIGSCIFAVNNPIANDSIIISVNTTFHGGQFKLTALKKRQLITFAGVHRKFIIYISVLTWMAFHFVRVVVAFLRQFDHMNDTHSTHIHNTRRRKWPYARISHCIAFTLLLFRHAIHQFILDRCWDC